MTTTCQICGRVIQANTGLIAHHGYCRPQGWHSQTRSCFGARFRPYEAAHDALDEYIPIIKDWLARTLEKRARLIVEPPETLTFNRRLWGGRTEPVEVKRPAGFEPLRHVDAGSYRPQTYEGEFTRACGELKREAAGLTEELKYLRDRLAEWKETL